MYSVTINGSLGSLELNEKQYFDTVRMVSMVDKLAQIITVGANTIINFSNGDMHIYSKVE